MNGSSISSSRNTAQPTDMAQRKWTIITALLLGESRPKRVTKQPVQTWQSYLTPASNWCVVRAFDARFFGYQFQALCKHAIGGCPSIMRSLGVVMVKVAFRVCLHLFHRFIPGRSFLDTEVFIQQRAVQSFNKAVVLAWFGALSLLATRTARRGGHRLEQQEQQRSASVGA